MIQEACQDDAPLLQVFFINFIEEINLVIPPAIPAAAVLEKLIGWQPDQLERLMIGASGSVQREEPGLFHET